VFSFGNDTDLGSSLTKYLEREAPRRNTTVFRIQTTAEQEAAILEYLRQFTRRNAVGVYPDNCVNRTNLALRAGQVDIPEPLSPVPDSLLRAMLNLERRGGAQRMFLPRYGEVPTSLEEFNPR